MSSSSGHPPSGGGRMPLPFDPSLLQPIVRPKRTPMACLECRRRQVKCSGTTPRCERCKKKGIECAYMSLSEQRSTGGSISRSGTPQAAGASGQAQQQQSTRLAYQAQWPQDTQALPTGTTYAAPQGWQGATPMQGSSSAGQYGHAQSGGQGYPNAQMVYPQGYTQQQAAYAQSQGGVAVPGGGAQADLYAQGYGMAAQQGFASGTTYNAYGHGVPNMDPTYAYQASQMGAGLPGVDQQGAPYGGQYASQMYFDPSAVQMMSADAAAAQQWAGNTQGYQGHGFPGQ